MRILLIIAALILYSCGFGNKESNSNDASTENVGSTESTKEVEVEKWRDWQAPASVGGYSLDALVLDPYKNSKLYSALAVYKNGADIFRVQIVDGTTEKGKSEIRDHYKIADQNLNTESDYGYEKNVVRNGIKTKEDHIAATGDYMIKYLINDTYGVSVKSNAESADKVWQLIEALQLEKLN